MGPKHSLVAEGADPPDVLDLRPMEHLDKADASTVVILAHLGSRTSFDGVAGVLVRRATDSTSIPGPGSLYV